MHTNHSCSQVGRGSFSSLRGTIPLREPDRLGLRTSVAAVFLVAALALPAPAGFVTAPLYPVGSGSSFQLVGDFNGDGIPDLAVPNFSNTRARERYGQCVARKRGRHTPARPNVRGRRPVAYFPGCGGL